MENSTLQVCEVITFLSEPLECYKFVRVIPHEKVSSLRLRVLRLVQQAVPVGVVVGIERGHAPRPAGIGDSIAHRALFKFLAATEVEPVAKRQVIEPVEVMTMRGRLQVHGEHPLGCP